MDFYMTLDKISLLGICSDHNSSYRKGASEAPPLIRAAFHCDAGNYFSESGANLARAGLFDDIGDIYPAAGIQGQAEIENAVENLCKVGNPAIFFGGDHAITYPIICAISNFYSPITILHFDAHPDLYDEFQGSRLSHACPFARIMENGLVKRLIQIGVRTVEDVQRKQAKRFGVEMIEMKDLEKIGDIHIDTPLYLSFDMDALDPAFAPGISHREPGGLSTRQVLNIIHKINAPLIGADIVEFNPRMDVGDLTAMVCAKLFKEIAAKMLEDRNEISCPGN